VVFLARGLSAVPDDERFERTDEEATMVPAWIPLDDAVDAALGGRLHSPTAVTGVLAAAAARARGWSSLEAVEL
jgi:8-oxo-dGDP phosphatase